MDFQTLASIAFVFFLSLFLYSKRKEIVVQKIIYPLLYFAMYKTNFGIKTMERFARKFRKALKRIGYIGVFLGFVGMAFICFELVRNMILIFTKPEAAPGVGVVLPIEAKGVFYVPFFYWIISIVVIAFIHEFAHGIIARSWRVRIKSSGFAFLGVLIPIIPAAFVEPDEKELRRRPRKEQLSVFAAGPIANVIFGFIFLGILYWLFLPAANAIMLQDGVQIVHVADNESFPARRAGLSVGELITAINTNSTRTIEDFKRALEGKKPGEVIKLATNKSNYTIRLGTHPEKRNVGYLGVSVIQHHKVKERVNQSYSYILPFFFWIAGLVNWLFLLNIGIGLFNLVPIGPVDGGRMLKLLSEAVFGIRKGRLVWKLTSSIFSFIVIAIVLFSFLR